MLINISHILELSNIKMNDKEIVLLEQQLSNIIDWLDAIAKCDTTGIEPMYNVLQYLNINHFQDKNVTEVVDIKDILSNAPETFDTFFTVPRVVDA
jgi:aspartyl-tRNA(Asn)/glutamyl-tRNA(Gln) amidotransferase subunit C